MVRCNMLKDPLKAKRILNWVQKEKNQATQNTRSQGRNDQQYGTNQYSQQSYGQQVAAGQAQAQPANSSEDPYAAYGGYQNYVMLWAMAQSQSGQGQAPGGQQGPPGA